MSDKRKPYRLSGVHFWTLSLSLLFLWVTGIAWLYLHHFGQVETEFGVSANPAEHWLLCLHGLCLIPALIALGGILFAHIPGSWSFEAMKPSGLTQALLFLILIVTGYLLYYAGGELLRNGASLVHWALGTLVPLIFFWHYLSRKSVISKE